MTAECLAYGSLISLVVSALKPIPAVKRHPKLVAFVLTWVAPAAIAAWNASQASPVDGATAGVVLRCVAEQFAAAVAVHETVVQPASKRADREAQRTRAAQQRAGRR